MKKTIMIPSIMAAAALCMDFFLYVVGTVSSDHPLLVCLVVRVFEIHSQYSIERFCNAGKTLL